MRQDELRAQLERAAADLGADGVDVRLERPRNLDHGDVATNLAMVLAGRLGRAPREIAEDLLERLDPPAAGLEDAEVAGPGFINFRFAHERLRERLTDILAAGPGYGRADFGAGRRVNVEFVSANPTGPLHVAHGRGAALGDVIATLLEWTGHDAVREFYVNDAGAQIEKLAASLEARWLELAGEDAEIPEGGYRGDYLVGMARAVEEDRGPELRAMGRADRLAWMRDYAVTRLRAEQDADLRAFGVDVERYAPESELYESGAVEATLERFAERRLSYEREGAVWLKTSDFGDDKDRVLVKSDGGYTYFLPDVAYHRGKADRGVDRAIDVLGADHHGYVPRMRAALGALGLPDLLEAEIVQMVRVVRGGAEVRLSKRAGDFVTLRELFEETGRDVARYFFLMRRADAQMVFDLDLALDHSEKNPVFKVKYAHARIMSIFDRAGLAPAEITAEGAALDRLTTEHEEELTKHLGRFPEIIEEAARARAPHIVCDYLEQTAGRVNSWYHAGNPSRNPELAVLVSDEPLRRARLVLARAARIVLRNGLDVLGLEAPERMEREETP